jgi:hypothetical protein
MLVRTSWRRGHGYVRQKRALSRHGNDRAPAHRHHRPDEPVTPARVPGLIVPLVFLFALVAGAVWYWRHRGD